MPCDRQGCFGDWEERMKKNTKPSMMVMAASARVGAHCIVMLVVALVLPIGSVAAPQLRPASTEDAPLTPVYVPGVSGASFGRMTLGVPPCRLQC